MTAKHLFSQKISLFLPHFPYYTICLEADNSNLKVRIESLENVSTGLEASTSGKDNTFGNLSAP
ncbi:hypothetical protein QM480_01275 [Flectobacillus sp. DC10W]|uniref:Uncharacterized protein n=1 Tax=Flectobacillus longus TaxID=2984207 RepID=A0ABT6YH64_9BACT|nr:hypothetical protein [Flectobacillus longus]MDI9862938.1 hypothetical protein [Flectobacillus longus]